MAESNASKKLRALIKAFATLEGAAQLAIAAKWGSKVFELARTAAAAHRQPTGRAWKPRKRDKAPALPGFASSLGLKRAGLANTVSSGHVAAKAHNFGAKRARVGPIQEVDGKRAQKRDVWKLPVRRVLPKKAMPKEWAEPLLAIAEAEVRRVLGVR